MIYLSRLILNPRSRRVRNELADPYEMHRTVMKAFAGRLEDDERVLFRVEVQPRIGIPTLLVQSLHQPDWGELAEPGKNYLLDDSHLPFGVENPAVKEVDLALKAGQRLAFRLRANPTVKKVRRDENGQRRNGNRVPLVREDEQLKWLENKLDSAGGSLLSAQISNQSNLRGKLFKEKDKGRRMKFLSVQFEGILEVKEPASLLNTIQAGIGPGKGLGFGLLSLAPLQ
jgi:CRISPR system Cascade subunit CasE